MEINVKQNLVPIEVAFILKDLDSISDYRVEELKCFKKKKLIGQGYKEAILKDNKIIYRYTFAYDKSPDIIRTVTGSREE